ncbi:type II secretion system F family protein [Protaetiibacter intestinalis]|uniref:Uncharacterized protein n=1 Tax=Protaetiibacter intestinalis TaxID=2419774 RepID=A0A387BBC0_9MICO|nr:type II secretion system F family protein [Protaetiibacter intestinalis]AYF98249.1 hypothetical protein D7I47_08270 [Protaetiibacter intestinalis]
MRARPQPGEEADAVADAVQRLAVLLTAGLDPLGALRALPASRPAALAAAAASDSPHDVPDAIRGADRGAVWALVAAQWHVAVEAGAPLAATLERTVESLRALADAERQLDLALAGPLATARIVALLPLAGAGLGMLVGADPLGVVFGTVPGAVAALLGVALLIAGLRWNRRLVDRARGSEPLAGLGAELLALALSGGGAPDRALALVASAAERSGLPAAVDEARETLAFAIGAGVPAAVLLRAEATRARRVALAEVLRRAALLGTRLLAPLGLCFLPSFVLLGVVPLVLGILRGTLSAF